MEEDDCSTTCILASRCEKTLCAFLFDFFAEDPILACCDCQTILVYGGFLRRAVEHILDKGNVTDADMRVYLLKEGGDVDVRTTAFDPSRLPEGAKYKEVELLYNNKSTPPKCTSYMVWVPHSTNKNKFIRYEIGAYDYRVQLNWTDDYTVNSLVWRLGVQNKLFDWNPWWFGDIRHRRISPTFKEIGQVGMKKLWRARRLWQQGYRPERPGAFLQTISRVLVHDQDVYIRGRYTNDSRVWACDLSAPPEGKEIFKTKCVTKAVLREDETFQEIMGWLVEKIFK